jgi:hypothetical protein
MTAALTLLDGDEPGTERRKLRAFGVLLALVVCTEYWTKYLNRVDEVGAVTIAALVVVTALTGLIVHGRLRRPAFAGIALLQIGYVVRLFPMAGNHRYLEAGFAGLVALLDDEDGSERTLLLRALRSMAVIVLFYSGVQKLAHGYWFRGQFLAWALWSDSFQAALEPLFAPQAFAQLSTSAWSAGDGPFLATSLSLVLLSNAIWVAELGLAVLLIPRATRTFAWIATCGLILAMEVVTRELMFGVEFAAAILLFARGNALRRSVLPLALLLLAALLVRLGVLPEAGFH